MTKRFVKAGLILFSILFSGICIPSSPDQNFLDRSQRMAYAVGYDTGSNIRGRQEYVSSRTTQNLVRIETVRQAIRDAWNDQPLRCNDRQRDDAKKEVDQLLVKSWVPALVSGIGASASPAVCYSYALGVELAYSVRLMRDQLDLEQLLTGFDQGFDRAPSRLDQATRDGLLTAIREELDNRRIQMGALNWKNSIDFMLGNGKRPGVQTLPSGLQYEVITSGHGRAPIDTDQVTVAYTGALINGQVFDDSRSRGRPASFLVGNVIPGFTEGLRLMSVGSRYKLYIPPELAYGDRGAGTRIEPNQALIFDVELLDVQSTTGQQNEVTPVGAGTNRQGAVSWVSQIATKIRSNWRMPVGRPATFECRVKVKLMPNGSVISAEVVKSCGQSALDDSLTKAVFKADPLPVPDDPKVFDSNLILTFSS